MLNVAIFQELAVLVRDQGEKVDRIDNHIYEATERAQQAHEELKKAHVSANAARKKKLICCFVGIIVLIVVILIIIFSVVPDS